MFSNETLGENINHNELRFPNWRWIIHYNEREKSIFYIELKNTKAHFFSFCFIYVLQTRKFCLKDSLDALWCLHRCLSCIIFGLKIFFDEYLLLPDTAKQNLFRLGIKRQLQLIMSAFLNKHKTCWTVSDWLKMDFVNGIYTTLSFGTNAFNDYKCL